MTSTSVTQHIHASRAAVYRTLLDPDAIAHWRVPHGMTSHIHEFDAKEGGTFRVSLTYTMDSGTGKTTAHTDTYHGRFVKLIENEQVVEVVEFETTNPAMQGEMTITTTLVDANGGTELHGLHEDLPTGVSPADNEYGWQQSLKKLAALVEEARKA